MITSYCPCLNLMITIGNPFIMQIKIHTSYSPCLNPSPSTLRDRIPETWPWRARPCQEKDKPSLQDLQTKSGGCRLHASLPLQSACELYQAESNQRLWPCTSTPPSLSVGRATETHKSSHLSHDISLLASAAHASIPPLLLPLPLAQTLLL